MNKHQRAERGPRGQYARLICSGCRSRKIKCWLPNPKGPISVLGAPQPAEEACERCRNLNLECIVERTSLGRPPAKRTRRTDSQANSNYLSASATIELDSSLNDGSSSSTPSSMEIKGYLFSETADDSLIFQNDATMSKTPGKQDIFRSMLEPGFFVSSILVNDLVFGSCIPHATSRWNMSLPGLVSNELAILLDDCLVWHRFFLPQTPTLSSIRKRLISDDSISRNSATNLLFALLCVIALEMPESRSRQNPQLLQSLQLAVSFFGQDFIFSPPTHRDSIVVSLLLSDYKPTALVTSQHAAHKAVQSGLFINLAYRIAERLQLMPAHAVLDPTELEAADPLVLERYLTDSMQGMYIYCYEAFTDGFIVKPLPTMRHMISVMKKHIDIYQSVLRDRQCSPQIIYHIQYTTGSYILMEAMANMKQTWKSLENLSMIIQEAERKCLEHIEFSNLSLTDSPDDREQDEVSAVKFLLEMRFRAVYVFICGVALWYATVLRARFQSGKTGGDHEIHSDEAIQVVRQVMGAFDCSPPEAIISLPTFLLTFGSPFPSKMGDIMEMFIQCTDTLKLNGVAFHPPSRHLMLELVSYAKNIVENNVIVYKTFGRLNPQFDRQLELFGKCTQRLEGMIAAPWNSSDSAFAGGCVYAVGAKLIRSLCELMVNLKAKISQQDVLDQSRNMLNIPPPSIPTAATPMTHPDNYSNGLSGGDFSSIGSLDMWPHVGGVDFWGALQDDQFNWSSVVGLFPDIDSENASSL
ncbi:hypothetical protein FQN55_006501 [Onygenales sp. PD_40]|nr:hypothetical protein FQN55_006501 [Onygenales sp. PD_40]